MKSVYKIVIPLLFFIQYLGLGAIAQIVILLFVVIELFRGARISLSDADRFLFFCVFITFIFKMLLVPLEVNLLLFRFYWGFVLFYLFFLIAKFKIDFLLLFWITAIVSMLEGFLLNTILPLGVLKNIPAEHINVINNEMGLSFVRAYGLASSPTSSATIMVILLTCVYVFQQEKFKDYFLLPTAGALISFGSGTGFLLFFVFLFVKYKLYKGFKLFFGLIVIYAATVFVMNQDISEGGILMRVSGNYFGALIDLKTIQITEVLNKINESVYNTILGVSYKSIEEVRVMSDFGWIDFLECYGFIGISMFMLFLIFKKKIFTLPVLIILLGFFHYPAIGSIPGQILFASILSYHFISKKKQSISVIHK
jgi:hypothetical protein